MCQSVRLSVWVQQVPPLTSKYPQTNSVAGGDEELSDYRSVFLFVLWNFINRSTKRPNEYKVTHRRHHEKNDTLCMKFDVFQK